MDGYFSCFIQQIFSINVPSFCVNIGKRLFVEAHFKANINYWGSEVLAITKLMEIFRPALRSRDRHIFM